MSRFQRSQDTLYSLAKDTGGKAFFDFNDLSLGIVQARDAQGSYYIIGYYSTHIANDGKFRRVTSLARQQPSRASWPTARAITGTRNGRSRAPRIGSVSSKKR